MLCWVNGVFVDEGQVMEYLVLDEMIYTEIFRTYDGHVAFLASYYTQLCERLKDYQLMLPYSMTVIQEVIARLNAQDGKDGAISIHVTAAYPLPVPSLNEESEIFVMVMRCPVDPVSFYRERQARWLQTSYSKDSPSTHIRAGLELGHLHLVEGFFVTRRGEVAMSITSIIFWAKDDILYTPSLHVGIYPTVPRQLVIQLAKKMGYQVCEGIYVPYEVEEAHECFIVNPIDEILPIHRLGAATFAGQDGLLYERLYHAYGYEISRELRRD